VVDRFAPNNCDHNARTAEEEGEDDKGDSFCRPSDQANTMTTVTSAATADNNPRTKGVRHCEIAGATEFAGSAGAGALRSTNSGA